MEDEEKLFEVIKDYMELRYEKQQQFLAKYPSDVPNEVCFHAFLRGISIENSFKPTVGNYIPFFDTPFEKIYIWTYKKDTYSALISEVNINIKKEAFWKNTATIIELALSFNRAFEAVTFDGEKIDYKWMYYFQPDCLIDDLVFNNLDEIESSCMSYGENVKATTIASIANIIELLIRDDKAFTAMSLLNSSFEIHYCCLICELNKHPIYHDHLTQEPQIWEQSYLLPKMETAIVQSCRCVESILGEPPNKNNRNALLRHKEKWNMVIGINPDDIYEKSGKSYLEFYYSLFFELRNSSAHSYGNVHFDLERKKVVEAQCFAAIIMKNYFTQNVLKNVQAMKMLNFNIELLGNVSENMSTSVTE